MSAVLQLPPWYGRACGGVDAVQTQVAESWQTVRALHESAQHAASAVAYCGFHALYRTLLLMVWPAYGLFWRWRQQNATMGALGWPAT
eukprot:350327-Chlamydomonas_euryale.AAC.3